MENKRGIGSLDDISGKECIAEGKVIVRERGVIAGRGSFLRGQLNLK
jgi:hypothetical protein